MTTNTNNAVQTRITPELEDRIMAALPSRISRWLREEAATDICTAQIFRDWRAGASVDAILAHLRGTQRRATRDIYGAAHPQAAYA